MFRSDALIAATKVLQAAARDNDVREIVRLVTHWKRDGDCSYIYLLEGRDRRGMTPLLIALETGQLEATRVLLLLGAGSHFVGPDEEDGLDYVAPDRFDLVWALVTHDKFKSESDKFAEEAVQALHYAVRRDNLLFARELIKRGAPINGKAYGCYENRLIGAVEASNHAWRRDHGGEAIPAEKSVGDPLEMTALLLENGGDVHVDNDQCTLHAARCGNLPLVNLLRSHGAIYSLSVAALLGDTDAVRTWVEAGADIEADPDDYGETPLSVAAERGYTEIVAYLLSRGANVRPFGHGWAEPLGEAVSGRHYDCVTLLCDYGAAADNVDALNSAVHIGDERMVRTLLNAGAPVNGVGTGGDTPLMVAAEQGRAVIAELLRLCLVGL